jgi:hypothetical protein
MKERCPNCGFVSYTGLSRCGCTWSEQLAAAKFQERLRRQDLAKQGRPVLVDHQSHNK